MFKQNDLINSREEFKLVLKNLTQKISNVKKPTIVLFILILYLMIPQTIVKVLEAIKKDQKLEYNGHQVLLTTWFVRGCDAKVNQTSILQSITSYIRNIALENKSQYKKK